MNEIVVSESSAWIFILGITVGLMMLKLYQISWKNTVLRNYRHEKNKQKKAAYLRQKQRAAELASDQQKLDDLRDAVAQMREVWLDQTSSERKCQKLLLENLWVLQPEYLVSKREFYEENNIKT